MNVPGFRSHIEDEIRPFFKTLNLKAQNDILKLLGGCTTLKACQAAVIQINLEHNLAIDWDDLLEKYTPEDNSFDDVNITAAKKFVKSQPLYYDGAGIWWVWNHKEFRYEMSDEVDILNLIRLTKSGNDLTNFGVKRKWIEALKMVGRENKPKELKGYVQFKDVIINTKTWESFKVTPKLFATNPIPWEFGESPETPTMDRIFKEWVGEEYVQTLYEILAYCTLPDYPIQRLFCLFGDGLNGKSKYLELLQKFIGISNITSTELDTLLSSRFEISRLYKRLACVMGETNFNELGKTSILKKLTGNDLIGFEIKHRDHFQDVNYAKIIISTNNLPPTNDKTIGFSRRWLIIDFPNRFNEKKDILSEIPEEEYKNLTLKVYYILQKLLKKREFTNEGSIEQRAKKFEEISNPFDKFWAEMIEEEPDGHIYKFEFRDELKDWCLANRFRQMSDKVIQKYMKERGVDTQKMSTEWYKDDGQRKRYWSWVGIRWKGSK